MAAYSFSTPKVVAHTQPLARLGNWLLLKLLNSSGDRVNIDTERVIVHGVPIGELTASAVPVPAVVGGPQPVLPFDWGRYNSNDVPDHDSDEDQGNNERDD